MKRLLLLLVLFIAVPSFGLTPDKAQYTLYSSGFVYCHEGAIVVERSRVNQFPAANMVYVPAGWYFNPVTLSTQTYGPYGEPVATHRYKLGKSKIFEVNGRYYRITTVETVEL